MPPNPLVIYFLLSSNPLFISEESSSTTGHVLQKPAHGVMECWSKNHLRLEITDCRRKNGIWNHKSKIIDFDPPLG
jgi:hypothetical protein